MPCKKSQEETCCNLFHAPCIWNGRAYHDGDYMYHTCSTLTNSPAETVPSSIESESASSRILSIPADLKYPPTADDGSEGAAFAAAAAAAAAVAAAASSGEGPAATAGFDADFAAFSCRKIVTNAVSEQGVIGGEKYGAGRGGAGSLRKGQHQHWHPAGLCVKQLQKNHRQRL